MKTFLLILLVLTTAILIAFKLLPLFRKLKLLIMAWQIKRIANNQKTVAAKQQLLDIYNGIMNLIKHGEK